MRVYFSSLIHPEHAEEAVTHMLYNILHIYSLIFGTNGFLHFWNKYDFYKKHRTFRNSKPHTNPATLNMSIDSSVNSRTDWKLEYFLKDSHVYSCWT